MHRHRLFVLVLAGFAWLGGAVAADAALCQKRNGTLVLRDACGKRETAVSAEMLGVVGTPGPQGLRGPKGEPGEPGPKGDAVAPSVRYSWQIPSAFIGTAGGNGVAVASMSLAPGKYLMMAKVDAVNFGLATYVRCGIDVGAARVHQATTFIGVGGADNTGLVETLSLLVPVDAPDGAAVYVRCRPDAATGTNESAYIEAGILVAIPVSAIGQ